MSDAPPHPYMARELAELPVGSALDVGCGAGAEALWLAAGGWHVTAVDISSAALDHARNRAQRTGLQDQLGWKQQDVTRWQPARSFDLVMTNYAHATIPQLDLYQRIAQWVRPGGTLLVVGHAEQAQYEHHRGHDDAGHPPAKASVTAQDITARIPGWDVITADCVSRTVSMQDGKQVSLRDVVVRAVRPQELSEDSFRAERTLS
ncbi:class I SAM-dependent methyltransferase [Nesterenkonia massiliensis]|uniref:Class I SAM-dependent methyltransferase n=2 Tax=Nesterenkonia massiliensis TaxID=1232429 RepID=A0ABT2HNG0_9MICC|nr:class I SAM-dependent methyltransferase [Nesterenkonia massiliensis]